MSSQHSGGALVVQKPNRRTFLQTTAGTLAFGWNAIPAATQASTTAANKVPAFPPNQTAPVLASNEGKKPLRLGLIIAIGRDPGAAIAKVRDLGLVSCQVFVSDFDPQDAAPLRRALDQNKIEATSLVVGGPGREVWDFYDGPLTIGLVPRDTRAARIAHLKKTSDFAKQCGIPAVQTHCGFIPENPNDPLYKEVVTAIRDVGLDNQGVNFDLANLILYGKANPVDAIETLAPYVQGIHAKDGLFPTNAHQLGEEVPIGKGKVDFPLIIARLKQLQYGGAVTIEREISGPRQIEDVRAANEYLEALIG